MIISNDQPQEFYDAYVDNAGRFADYVAGGGFLWMETASGGFNGGDFSGATLPGGVTVSDFVFDEFNDVAAPDHDLMAGVPDPVLRDATRATTSTRTCRQTRASSRRARRPASRPSSSTTSAAAMSWPSPSPWNGRSPTTRTARRILENAVPYAVNFFRDLSWLSENPATGSLGIGEDQSVAITIGEPSLAPGEYRGSVVFATTAPKPRQVTVDVTLTVELPESWGGLAGTVVDAHTEEPLDGVSVTVHSQWDGAPFDIVATTAGDGTFSLIGPEGTWPVTFSKDGYVPVDTDATIVRGVTTEGIDAALHRNQPHAALDGTVPEFVLTEGRTGSATVTLSNPGGHTDLEFEIGEVDLGGPASGVAVARSGSKVTLPAGADPNARTTRGLGAAAPGTQCRRESRPRAMSSPDGRPG